MTTTSSTTTADEHADTAAGARTWPAVVLAAVALLAGVISLSVNAPMDDPFEADARVLISTFGVGMALLAAAVALGPFRRGERWAWAILWVWPAFFVVHVATLGTVVPDAPLAALTTVALLAGRPR